jgi:hypothetical protein
MPINVSKEHANALKESSFEWRSIVGCRTPSFAAEPLRTRSNVDTLPEHAVALIDYGYGLIDPYAFAIAVNSYMPVQER